MNFNSYKSFFLLKQAILEFIKNEDYENALILIHDFVDKIITEPLLTSTILGSRELDFLCSYIGSANLKRLNLASVDSCRQIDDFVYLITKIQKSGGYINVIEDFIKSRPDSNHLILISELEGKSEIDLFLSRFDISNKVEIKISPTHKYMLTLDWLQQELAQNGAATVYLFNHPQDSVAVACLQPGLFKKAFFYHHSDHHLSLGVHIKYFEHIDFHPMGYHFCRDILSIQNKYIPLVFHDKGKLPQGKRFKENGFLNTATAARSNKIEIPYYVSYLEVIPKLLSVTNGRHIHIGHLTPWALFKIRRQLKKRGVSNNRFIYIPWVSSVWEALHEYKIDLYIGSFPYGGGLTLVEAMGAGVPVALHKHFHSRVLSCIDLAYKDVFKWQDPEELLDYCKNITSADLEKLSRFARDRYEKYHDPRILVDILNDSKSIEAPPNMIKHFDLNTDEIIFWLERQVSAYHIIRRTLYRFMKRLRARFF
jgi:hypothetical protein